MAEDYVQVNVPASLGKKLKTWTSIEGSTEVHSEAVTLTAADGTEIVPASQTTQVSILAGLETLNSLVPTQYDYIDLGYTGPDLTTVVYKLGGTGGIVVSTLTLAYSGGNLISVART